MAKKKTYDNLLDNIRNSLSGGESNFIPDIVTFVESERYLSLGYGPNPIYLRPAQKLILKAFYRGSIGNENLEITEDDIELCKKLKLTDHDDRGNVLEKLDNKEVFRELVLVWGRRSGKDFITSIIACYEAMKLLELPGGDPYRYYNIGSAVPISILTVANSKPQARIAFNEIRQKVLYSPYFKDKYISDGIEAEAIYLLTPQDKTLNEHFSEKGLPLKKGSVCIEVGHSNSDSLLGKGVFALLLDEVATYKNTGGASSGDRIYTALQPALTTYFRRIPKTDEEGNLKLDEDGKQEYRIIFDSKIVSISSPRGKEGKLYDLFIGAANTEDRLSCRLPTWDVNHLVTRESLKETNSDMSEENFMMEFGAEFSGTAGETFFLRDAIEDCFKNHKYTENRLIGEPGKIYFAHLDPATNSHNYALVVLHKELVMNREDNKSDFIIIVDHIKIWSPHVDRPIDPNEVDEYMIQLRRRFHLSCVTYDQWQSAASIMKLKKHGIPAKLTRFNQHYEMAIYTELENLVNSRRIKIPYHQLLRDEMLSLQRKYTGTGFKIYPNQEGDGCHTDDILDCVAAASYMIMSQENIRLPRSKLVNTGSHGSHGSFNSNNIAWKNMQGGVYGVGSGGSVSRNLEKRNSWPQYKR